jgi:hypothetical protein
MFTKTALIKSINELYFRGSRNLHEDLCNLSIPCSYGNTEASLKRDIKNNIEILQALNEIKSEFYLMHIDLLNYDNDKQNFKSAVAKEQEVTRKVFSTKVKRTLPINGDLKSIIDILSVLSKESYLVGGSVRDAIIGSASKDYDFVTDVPYDELSNAFKEQGFSVKETGKQFLVMNVIKGKTQVEIANFRKDGTYKNGRRPEFVEIGNIFDDATRRDFTVNSLYYNLSEEVLIDPTGNGIPDIKDRVLRFNGKPEDRIFEDYLRVWRFYRFLGKGFKPGSKDLKAVRTHFKDAQAKTDPMRVQQELERIIGL